MKSKTIRPINPKKKRHYGKSYGLCKKCHKKFKLKRITKHDHNKILKNVICPKCGKPKKKKIKSIKELIAIR